MQQRARARGRRGRGSESEREKGTRKNRCVPEKCQPKIHLKNLENAQRSLPVQSLSHARSLSLSLGCALLRSLDAQPPAARAHFDWLRGTRESCARSTRVPIVARSAHASRSYKSRACTTRRAEQFRPAT